MSEPEYNPKMLSAKMKLLERFCARAPQPETDAEHRRLPPGQHQVSGFPVLDLGVRPRDSGRLAGIMIMETRGGSSAIASGETPHWQEKE